MKQKTAFLFEGQFYWNEVNFCWGLIFPSWHHFGSIIWEKYSFLGRDKFRYINAVYNL